MTEFFADFGTFDVKVTLPKDYVIGATGVQVSDQDNGNGTKTVALPRRRCSRLRLDRRSQLQGHRVETFNGSVGPVHIRLLSYDSHDSEWQPYITASTTA